MSKNTVIAGVVIVVLILAGWYLMRPKGTTTPEVSQSTPPAATESANASPSAMMAEKKVTISSTGFLPKSITIKAGESVTWTNNDSANHTVNSDPHPTHTLYPFLNLGLIKPGAEKSVTVSETGSYTYHDHLNPSLTGSITVE